MAVETEKWTTAWPTETGWYWFYGWRSTFGRNNQLPQMMFVEIRRISNGVIAITHGTFIFEKEGAYGKWLKAELPEPPEL